MEDKEIKIGDQVIIRAEARSDGTYYGHVPGDIGIVKSRDGSLCNVEVEGRVSQSHRKPCVGYLVDELELVSQSVDNYQIF
jgi:hypothetical protein